MRETFWQRKYSFSRGALAAFLGAFFLLALYVGLVEFAWISGGAGANSSATSSQDIAVWSALATIESRLRGLEQRDNSTRSCLHSAILSVRHRRAPRPCV
jgi:hypothetical protein